MNKFLKGTLASAMIVPCVFGFTGCNKEKDKTAEIYAEVYDEVTSLATPFQNMATPGAEAQLTVNMTIDYKTIVEGIASAQTSVTANLRAVIGARNNNNQEMFGNIGFVDAQNNYTSLLSAYAVDDVDSTADVDTDEEFTLVGPILAEHWDLFKGLVYVENAGAYVLASEIHDPEASYYMLTQDLLHFYMESNMSALNEYINMDISEYLPISIEDGKMYATLNIGSDVPDISSTPEHDEGESEFDVEEILTKINELQDFETFKVEMAEAGVTISSQSNKNHETSLTLTQEGLTAKFIVKDGGGLTIVVNTETDYGTYKDNITITIDMFVADEIDITYIPTDLTDYGEAQDLEEVVMGFIGSIMPPVE